MDSPRIELGTPRCKRGVLPLDYEPISVLKYNALKGLSSKWFIILSLTSIIFSNDFIFVKMGRMQKILLFFRR